MTTWDCSDQNNLEQNDTDPPRMLRTRLGCFTCNKILVGRYGFLIGGLSSELRLSSKLIFAKSSAIILSIIVAMPCTMFNWPIFDSFFSFLELICHRHVSSKTKFQKFLKISNFWLNLDWCDVILTGLRLTEFRFGIRIIPMQCGQWKINSNVGQRISRV